jgi:hypothetical protein
MTATWADREKWILGVRCAGPDMHSWDLPDDSSGITPDNRKAIRICRTRCPVLVACAKAVLDEAERADRGDCPWGVIRAGIPLRKGTGSYCEMSPITRAQLEAIAGDPT